MKKRLYILAALAAFGFSMWELPAMAQGIANITSEWIGGNLVFKNASTGVTIFTLGSTGDVTMAELSTATLKLPNLAVSEATPSAVLDGGDAYVEDKLMENGPIIPTISAVELTSPTLTFSVAHKSAVSLTSNANITGAYPTGGKLNQRLLIIMGAGSNTVRLDHGTSMTLNGSNLTFTEGQNDNLELLCTSAGGTTWRMLWHNGGS